MTDRCGMDSGRRVWILWVSMMAVAWILLAGADSTSANDLGPLEKFKDDAQPSIEMNKNGKKFNAFFFDHAAHVTPPYLFDGTCSSCHHTQADGAEAPKPCRDCHDIDGEAGEKKRKANAYHSKKSTWEGPADEGGISCVGCHKSHNKAIKAGTQKGAKAPTKCAGCHSKKKKKKK